MSDRVALAAALADRRDARERLGALCWNELATTAVERAKTFFDELLGWEYDTDAGGYVSIKNSGRLNGDIRELDARGLRPRRVPPSGRPGARTGA